MREFNNFLEHWWSIVINTNVATTLTTVTTIVTTFWSAWKGGLKSSSLEAETEMGIPIYMIYW